MQIGWLRTCIQNKLACYVSSILTLFRMGIFGAAHGWGGGEQKGHSSLKSVTMIKSVNLSYNDETWHSYILTQEDPKNIRIT